MGYLLNQKIEAKKLSEMRRNLTLLRNCRVMAEKRSGSLRHVQTRSRSQHLAGREISHFQTAKVRREKKDILFFRFLYFDLVDLRWPSAVFARPLADAIQ